MFSHITKCIFNFDAPGTKENYKVSECSSALAAKARGAIAFGLIFCFFFIKEKERQEEKKIMFGISLSLFLIDMKMLLFYSGWKTDECHC